MAKTLVGNFQSCTHVHTCMYVCTYSTYILALLSVCICVTMVYAYLQFSIRCGPPVGAVYWEGEVILQLS